jgi:hypothetical protein
MAVNPAIYLAEIRRAEEDQLWLNRQDVVHKGSAIERQRLRALGLMKEAAQFCSASCVLHGVIE